MKPRRRQALSIWLQGVLAMLLTLQLGLAQATMRFGDPVAGDEAVAAAGGADMPCHEAAATERGADQKPASGSSSHGCCDTGSCHCAAVSVLPEALHVSASPSAQPLLQAAPAGHSGQILIPDLRPPIG